MNPRHLYISRRVMGVKVWRCGRTTRGEICNYGTLPGALHDLLSGQGSQRRVVRDDCLSEAWEKYKTRGDNLKGGPERHLDRFVPHIVCDLIMHPSETFHAYPVSGNKSTIAWARLLFLYLKQ